MEETKTVQPFAVIETGGKQYKVAVGDILSVEKLGGDLNTGDAVTFDKVLLVDNMGESKIGSPYIDGAAVKAEFVEDGKGKKISIVRFKAKSNRSRKQGHRQPFSKVKITAIK